MKRVINPCANRIGQSLRQAFVEIQYKDGRLSMVGVIGPKSNGDAYGSCGQCVEEIRRGVPNTNEGWTAEMLQKLCDIWDEWHLNDMRPYCQHQKELGWLAKAEETVNLYHYRLNSKALRLQQDAEKAALAALRKGETFAPTADQVKFAAMPFAVTLHELPGSDFLENYEPKRPLYPGDSGPVETQMLHWLKPEKHPDGLLTRPCPVCGYRYGTSWQKEEVPQEIIDWLFGLPETTRTPAWV